MRCVRASLADGNKPRNWYALAAAAIGFAEFRMASLNSMCCRPFTPARIIAINAIVGFTSGGGTNGISAVIWSSSFAVFGACSVFELPLYKS